MQLWSEPASAGYSSLVLGETELDAAADRMHEAGIHHAGPEPGDGARILQVRDPDGNHMVFFHMVFFGS